MIVECLFCCGGGDGGVCGCNWYRYDDGDEENHVFEALVRSLDLSPISVGTSSLLSGHPSSLLSITGADLAFGDAGGGGGGVLS